MVYPWAFTRIWMLGVWRYLRNVDEAKSPRFLFVYTSAMDLTELTTIKITIENNEKVSLPCGILCHSVHSIIFM